MSKWFLNFFFCNTWREFFKTAAVAVPGALIAYALIVLTLIAID